MTKHREYFKLLISDNEEFFKKLAETYKNLEGNEDNKPSREEFEELKRQALRLVQKYENLLCSKSYKSGFGNFTNSLSEKFRIEVAKEFPYIS